MERTICLTLNQLQPISCFYCSKTLWLLCDFISTSVCIRRKSNTKLSYIYSKKKKMHKNLCSNSAYLSPLTCSFPAFLRRCKAPNTKPKVELKVFLLHAKWNNLTQHLQSCVDTHPAIHRCRFPFLFFFFPSRGTKGTTCKITRKTERKSKQ